MVLAYLPQRMKRSLNANSNYVPQGSAPGLVFDKMAYEDLDIMGYEPAGWLNANLAQRIPLTINTGQVPSTQTDFPLLINDVYPDLIGEVEAELRFAGIDNIQLEYEIQEFNSGTGELIAWVRKPTVSDGDSVFIYFDNPGAIDEQDPSAVWDASYGMVNHMIPDLLDSTSNNNNATNIGSTGAAGKIGRARSFDGNNDTLEVANASSLNVTNSITLSAWMSNPGDQNGFTIAKEDNPDRSYSLRRNNTNIRFIIDLGATSTLNGTGGLPDNIFYHISCTFNGTLMSIYINGVLNSSLSTTGTIVTNTNSLFIGSLNNFGVFFYDGEIDEVRLANVARSADYIKTEFNNQNDQNTFYSTGTVEQVPPSIIMGYENVV